MFDLALFDNERINAEAFAEPAETIYNIDELTIDTISADKQVIRYKNAGGELITRELNPGRYSMLICEAEL